MKNIKLTEEEKDIEKNIDNLQSIDKNKRAKIDSILSEARKSKSISLRISKYDLDKLKEKAEKAGIPYQTLVNSVLHKYVTNQLLDEADSIKLLRQTIS